MDINPLINIWSGFIGFSVTLYIGFCVIAATVCWLRDRSK